MVMARVIVICAVVLSQSFWKGAENHTESKRIHVVELFHTFLSFASRPVAYSKKDKVPGSDFFFPCLMNNNDTFY